MLLPRRPDRREIWIPEPWGVEDLVPVAPLSIRDPIAKESRRAFALFRSFRALALFWVTSHSADQLVRNAFFMPAGGRSTTEKLTATSWVFIL